jgi:hypothetical protein
MGFLLKGFLLCDRNRGAVSAALRAFLTLLRWLLHLRRRRRLHEPLKFLHWNPPVFA